MDDTISVALYARVSSQRQADEMTIQSQLAALRERIEQDGGKVTDELCFLDEGYTGGTLVRPGLERLRDTAWSGGIDELYVHSPDRLARKYAWQVLLLEELAKHNVKVVFLNFDAEDKSAESELLLQMQGMIAEYERAKILERSRRGRRFAARQGKVSVLGNAPHGYRYIRKQDGDGEACWTVVLEEAGLVKEMFTWVGIEGLSLGEIRRRLAEQKQPSPKGNPCWDKATIRDILLNPAYKGTAMYGKTRRVPRKPGGRAQRGAPEIPREETVRRYTTLSEQEPISVPGIVSEQLWNAAAQQLEENRRRYREQKKGPTNLLSGLLVCHRCGSAYCGQRQKRKSGNGHYVYYRCIGTDRYRFNGETICCNQSINGECLEQSVWSDLCELLRDPNRLRDEFRRRLEHPANEEFDVSHLKHSIARLKGRLSRLIDAYENGWMDRTEIEPRIRRAKERLAREEQALSNQQDTITNDSELRVLITEFEDFSQQVSSGLENADYEMKRSLLKLLIKRIEVDETEVRIVYKVQPRPFVQGPTSRGNFLQHRLNRADRPIDKRWGSSREKAELEFAGGSTAVYN